MWVAYLIPKQDLELLIEDGVSAMAKGETEREAIDALIAKLDEQSEMATVDDMLHYHVMHTVEL